MNKCKENESICLDFVNNSVFASLCQLTLSVCGLASFPDGTFSDTGNRWLELAIAWEKLLKDGSAGIFLDAVHRIMWGMPIGNSRQEYDDIVCLVKDELLRDGEAFAAWDAYVGCEVAIDAVDNDMDPWVTDGRTYRYSIEHYNYLCDRMLWKVRYCKEKYAADSSQYREAYLAYETAIKKIVPAAALWSEDHWCDENHILDEIIKIYGVDYRNDDLEYGRILLLLMGFEEDVYGIKEAWFATNITKLPMSLAKVIWPVNTEDKLMMLFFIAAEAAEALVGKKELLTFKKDRELHPVGVFEYCSIYSSWLYPLIREWIDGMDGNDEDVRDMKKKLFTIAMNN